MDNPSQTRTGFFVAVGIGLLIASILFFGGDRAFFTRYNQYEVKFSSTQGLGPGSVVSLAGVEVGNVKTIRFDDEMKLVATVEIERRFASRVTNESLANIRTQGALGDKYIYITVSPTGTPLKEGERIPTDVSPDFLDVISGKAADLSVAVDALKELNQLLHNINANGRSANLMESLLLASQNLGKLTGEPSIKESFLHLRNVLRKIDEGQGTLGELVNNSELHNRLMGILGEPSRNQYLKPLLREAIKQNESRR
jgi:phospholipid/cholesterol/gamma-HCH transport system substrate-binding protein